MFIISNWIVNRDNRQIYVKKKTKTISFFNIVNFQINYNKFDYIYLPHIIIIIMS